MRERLIKPDFTKDEDIPLLSRDARLFYILLWMYLDRKGRCEDRPLRIRAELFPYEPEIDVEPWLKELATTQKRVGQGTFIVRYEVGGVRYIDTPKLEKHQRFHPKEKQSNIPPSVSSIHSRENVRQAVELHGEPHHSAASNTNSILAARLQPGPSGPSVPSGPSGPSETNTHPNPPSSEGGDRSENVREVRPITKRDLDLAVLRILAAAAPNGAHRFDRRGRRALKDRLLGGEPEAAIIAALEAEARQAEEREQRARPFPGFVERVQAKMRGDLAGLGQPGSAAFAVVDAGPGQAPENGGAPPAAEPEADDAWELPPPLPIGERPWATLPLPSAVEAFLADYPGIDLEAAGEMWPAWLDAWALKTTTTLSDDDRAEWLWALMRQLTGGPDP